jgi:hypothetical protein
LLVPDVIGGVVPWPILAAAGGIKSLAVYASSPSEHVAYATNFETVGSWVFSGATAAVTKCGAYNVLGGFGVLDMKDSVSLTITDMIPHSTMTVSFDFIKVGASVIAVPINPRGRERAFTQMAAGGRV